MLSKADLFAYVLSLSQSDFQSLQKAVTYRANRDKYGFSTLDEAAEFYGRPVRCPDCRSTHCVSIGSSPGGNKRFQCPEQYSFLQSETLISGKDTSHAWFSVQQKNWQAICAEYRIRLPTYGGIRSLLQ